VKKEFLILTDEDYHQTMIDIYDLMNKGEGNLTSAETERLRLMAITAEKYEDEILHLKPVKPLVS